MVAVISTTPSAGNHPKPMLKKYLALSLLVALLAVTLGCSTAQKQPQPTDPTHTSCTIIPEETETIEPSISTAPTQVVEPTEPTPTVKPVKPHSVSKPDNYYGRLQIPEVKLDVALYLGADQSITDRKDSANVFTMSVFDGLYISDHSTQEFGKLLDVEVGMRGYIVLADGAKLSIACTEILTGRNTGKYIVDENGNTDFDGDVLMYTCRDSWRNVLICLWKHD